MHEFFKELIGFFSRWCLLGLAVGSGLLVAWVALSGASAVAAGVPIWVLSDEIYEPSKSVYVVAYLQPDSGVSSSGQFLHITSAGKVVLVYSSDFRFPIKLSKHTEGLHDVRIKGTPYGRFAFVQGRGICKVISPRRKVFALDARLVATFPSEQSRHLRSSLSELQARGEVVFCHSHRAEQFAELRDNLRQQYPNILQVFSTDRQSGITHTLRHLARTLHRSKREGIEVITGDPELAYAAAGEHFTTHLISSKLQDAPELRNPLRHETLVEFMKWLVTSDLQVESSDKRSR